MTDLLSIFRNYVLITSLLGWLTAQFLKVVLASISERRFAWKRFFGDGGMPSCHSSCVCALAFAVGKKVGFVSPEFAIAAIFAIVIIKDAMGVRRAAGEHAKVLNRMLKEEPMGGIDYFNDNEEEPKELKEYLGHTPWQVLCGSLIGVLVALLIPVF